MIISGVRRILNIMPASLNSNTLRTCLAILAAITLFVLHFPMGAQGVHAESPKSSSLLSEADSSGKTLLLVKLGNANLFSAHGKSPQVAKLLIEKALEQFEEAYEIGGELARARLSVSLAKGAFEAGQFDKARHHAELALQARPDAPYSPSGTFYANRIHHGNLVLGRIALREGDIHEAKSRLLAAAEVPGAFNLDSFGPNMMLAKELLEKGERKVVLEYFRLCSKFWRDGRMDQWAGSVKEGKIPNFRGNLYY